MTSGLKIALLLLAAQAGFAEDTSQWSSVQLLRKGDRVGVIQADRKRVEGRFESATDARITLRTDQEISLEKAQVVRVYRPARHSRVFLRNSSQPYGPIESATGSVKACRPQGLGQNMASACLAEWY